MVRAQERLRKAGKFILLFENSYYFLDLFGVSDFVVRQQDKPLIEIQAAQKRVRPPVGAQIPRCVFLQKDERTPQPVSDSRAACLFERVGQS
jgi:hypothetical protein